MKFDRWQQLSALASKEQDPEKLTELAKEMNRVLTEKNSVPRSSVARAAGIIISSRRQ